MSRGANGSTAASEWPCGRLSRAAGAVRFAGVAINTGMEAVSTAIVVVTISQSAALNILDGTVFKHNMKRHRQQELIRFLNPIGGPSA